MTNQPPDLDDPTDEDLDELQAAMATVTADIGEPHPLPQPPPMRATPPRPFDPNRDDTRPVEVIVRCPRHTAAYLMRLAEGPHGVEAMLWTDVERVVRDYVETILQRRPRLDLSAALDRIDHLQAQADRDGVVTAAKAADMAAQAAATSVMPDDARGDHDWPVPGDES